MTPEERKLASLFPNLRSGSFAITSPAESTYNCIALAAGETQRWWWPPPFVFMNQHWPPYASSAENLDSFREAFEGLGYELTDDGSLDPGFEKVALYARPDGKPTHAARQRSDGLWCSKLGHGWDIEHRAPEDVGGPPAGGGYGDVALFMRRSRSVITP